MSYVSTIYRAMNEFMRIRADARAEYLNAVAAIADARGTKYYADREAKAAEKRRAITEQAKKDCLAELEPTFDKMHRYNRSRKLEAPTEEMLRILQTLKLAEPERLTFDRLAQAANAMNGNATALFALQQLGDRAGTFHNWQAEADDLSIDECDKQIYRLASACRDIMRTSANPAAMMQAEYQSRRWNKTFDPDALPQVEPFESEEAFCKYTGTSDKLRATV